MMTNAGRKQIRVSAPAAAAALLCFASFLASCRGAGEEAPVAPEPPALARGSVPNIILVTVESLRPDRVGVYGGKSRSRPEVRLTPVLDALATEAVVYEDAHSVTSWTLASHASLFTGLYPSAHQTRRSTDLLDASYLTLAERLRERGYDTAGVVSGPYLRKTHNLHQGFVHYHDEIASESMASSHGDTTNPRVFEAMRRTIDAELDPSRPFLLFAYLWDPHYDYLPPGSYEAMFQGGDCEPINVRNYETTETVHPGIRPGQLSYVFSQYEGEIRWTDHHLGEFFDFLRAKGLWDDTVVIVTADHGEEFFDHGEKGHYHNVYAESVHVPLLVKYARGGAVGRDRRLVSLVDVVPTALELAGAPASGALDGRSLLEKDPGAGRSIFYELLSVWRVTDGKDTESGLPSFLSGLATFWNFVTSGGSPPAVPTRTQSWEGVRRGDHKLVVSAELDRRELYDVRRDPGEKTDVAASHPDLVRDLEEEIAAWKAEARRTASQFRKGGEAALTPEEAEHLRSLGYLQ
ncbi:MAG: sulfatase [Candidatus Binatia bacterium]